MEYLLLICGRLEKRVADKVRNNSRRDITMPKTRNEVPELDVKVSGGQKKFVRY
jgi:hypothetical protein